MNDLLLPPSVPLPPPSSPHPAKGPAVSPNISIFLVLGLAVIVTLGIFLLSLNKTSVEDLAVGDCFEIPSGQFTEVDNQSCDGPHEAQIIAQAPGSLVTRAGKAIQVPGQLSLSEKCFDALFRLDPAKVETLPDDYRIQAIGVVLNTFCVVESPSGSLVGSLVD